MSSSHIILTIPVGTATVEHSFRQMKLVKTRLCNRLSDRNMKDRYVTGCEKTAHFAQDFKIDDWY